MYDELTQVDIKKMREEIEYRVNVLRPKCIEDVQTARGFGDLSENFEYKAAKQEKNRNESRIRYLERMIKTAKVISGDSKPNEVGLFDSVELFFEEDGTTQTIRLTTTLRQDALLGIISPKSPLGKSLMGHKAGDRVRIEVNPEYSYYVVIRSIEKGQDDESLPISSY
jgi:transcription elongation factor GreA